MPGLVSRGLNYGEQNAVQHDDTIAVATEVHLVDADEAPAVTYPEQSGGMTNNDFELMSSIGVEDNSRCVQSMNSRGAITVVREKVMVNASSGGQNGEIDSENKLMGL
jgi:hypothetical protein